MNIQNIIEISTAHIPEHTAKALTYKSIAKLAKLAKLVYEPWDGKGGIIRIDPDYADEEHKELNSIIKYCQEHGIDYLKLDCDGDTVEEFPTFEW